MIKLLHTADWHLGRVLHHHSLLADQAHVLNQIMDYAVAHQVDAVLVAGDIYDRSMPLADAVRLLNQTINRFAELAIPLIMISGNHDSAERLGFAATQLHKTGLHILTDIQHVAEPVWLRKADTALQIFGIPFADPERVRHVFNQSVTDYDAAHNLLLDQVKAARDPHFPALLMSHCFVDGADTSESEKTLSVGGSDRVSYEPMLAFDYVALGHLHSPQSKGASHIRYAGSPLKYSFSEHLHKKGVTLLSFNSAGLVAQAHLPLQPLREMRVLEGTLNVLLAQGQQDPQRDDYIMVRLTDTTALLDPMGRLREVYPNVLHLEKRLLQTEPLAQANPNHIKLDAAQLVRDFYAQIQGEPLTDAQSDIINATLTKLLQPNQDNSL
ncbi:exonuclease SbcCD subunit D [Thiomicrospira aerophila]|uniref:exonuclease SbcCD subunit D n=1 Tax=Thiomicrospira aerophila TaxID=92245 RepID=UPI00022C1AB6|nr:exonuclease SbcCD subunit D [Thiomicrospira aerophila]